MTRMAPVNHWLWVLIPLLVLVADLARSPRLFHTSQSAENLSVKELLDRERIHLGRLRGHEIHVSFDEIASDDFLEGFRGERNGLVVTHFLTSDRKDSRYGLLGRVIRRRLHETDREAEQHFIQMIEQMPGREPGEAKRLKLERAITEGFPVSVIYVVILQEDGTGTARAGTLRRAMEQTFEFAAEDRLDNLVVPALGIDESADDLPFHDFLKSTFAATPEGVFPRNIFLSWYPRWKEETIEAATRALGDLRAPTFSQEESLAEKLQSPVLRLACIALGLCLLSSSFAVELNWRRFLIISCSFLGAFAALWGLVGFLTTGRSVDLTFVVRMVMTLVAAVSFRWTVTWDVKAIFVGRNGK